MSLAAIAGGYSYDTGTSNYGNSSNGIGNSGIGSGKGLKANINRLLFFHPCAAK